MICTGMEKRSDNMDFISGAVVGYIVGALNVLLWVLRDRGDNDDESV